MKTIKVLFTICFILFMSSAAFALVIPMHTQYMRMSADPHMYPQGVTNTDVRVKILSEPHNSIGYYAQYAFWFQNNALGYTGLQKDHYSHEGKKAIFSIWDSSSTVRARPDAPWCNYFDWESNGAQCIIKYDWVPNREYKLLVTKTWVGENRQPAWSGYIIDTVTQQWTLIGVIAVDNSPGLEGYGNLMQYTFTHEYYAGDNYKNASCNELPYFGVQWHGPFLPGENRLKYYVTDYSTGVGTQCPNINTRANGPFSVIQEAGQSVVQSTPDRTQLMNTALHSYFNDIDCFFDKLEKMFPQYTNNSRGEPSDQISYYDQQLGEYYRNYTQNAMGKVKGYKIAVDSLYDNIIVYQYPGPVMTNMGHHSYFISSFGCRFH